MAAAVVAVAETATAVRVCACVRACDWFCERAFHFASVCDACSTALTSSLTHSPPLCDSAHPANSHPHRRRHCAVCGRRWLRARRVAVAHGPVPSHVSVRAETATCRGFFLRFLFFDALNIARSLSLRHQLCLARGPRARAPTSQVAQHIAQHCGCAAERRRTLTSSAVLWPIQSCER